MLSCFTVSWDYLTNWLGRLYMSYRSANLPKLHFKYLFNKYTH